MTLKTLPVMWLSPSAKSPLAVLYDLWVFGDTSQVKSALCEAQSCVGLPLKPQPADLPHFLQADFQNSWRAPLFGQQEVQTAVDALKEPVWWGSLQVAHPEVMWWCMARHRYAAEAGAPSLPLVYFRALIPNVSEGVHPFVWLAGARVNHNARAQPWSVTWDSPQERDDVLDVMQKASWFPHEQRWARHHRLNEVLGCFEEGDKPARL